MAGAHPARARGVPRLDSSTRLLAGLCKPVGSSSEPVTQQPLPLRSSHAEGPQLSLERFSLDAQGRSGPREIPLVHRQPPLHGVSLHGSTLLGKRHFLCPPASTPA